MDLIYNFILGVISFLFILIFVYYGFLIVEINSLSVDGGLKGIFTFYECVSDASIEISRQEIYLVFAIMKTIIQPHRECVLIPTIFLLILFMGSWFRLWLRVNQL